LEVEPILLLLNFPKKGFHRRRSRQGSNPVGRYIGFGQFWSSQSSAAEKSRLLQYFLLEYLLICPSSVPLSKDSQRSR
jgi:hypothetical protein